MDSCLKLQKDVIWMELHIRYINFSLGCPVFHTITESENASVGGILDAADVAGVVLGLKPCSLSAINGTRFELSH